MVDPISMKNFPEISFFPSSDEIKKLVIETARLRMVSVTPKNQKDYEALFGNREVMKRFATGEIKDASYVNQRIETWVSRWGKGDPFSGLAVYEKESGEFLGHLILGYGDNPGQSELAFLFLPKFWNQGYGKEAVSAVIEHLAPKLASLGMMVDGAPFQEITATARIDSIASNRILSHHMTCVKQDEKYGALRNHYSRMLEQIEVIPTFWERVQSSTSAIFAHLQICNFFL